MRQLRQGMIALVLAAMASPGWGTTWWVDAGAENASDDNPGTEAEPWRTISRAAAAEELQPGDTVLVKSGVYREEVIIEQSGEPGRPLVFAAAAGHRAVIKGSDLVRGTWTRLADQPDLEEPYPNAYSRVWKVELGDEYFQGPYFGQPGREYLASVFVNDLHRLQQIGRDAVYNNEPYFRITQIGRDLTEIVFDSFYFERQSRTLYVCIAGSPSWYLMEVGVRPWLVRLVEVHDVVVRGFEMRHNRQPGGQWPAVSLSKCERVTMEDCRIWHADFLGLSLSSSRYCVVRRCDLSYNGCNGLNLHKSQDCLVEDRTVMFNNTRRFSAGWAAGGMKNIPDNVGCTITGCEVAYNIAAPGIWFDGGNVNCRILGNVVHHNGGPGIFYEINKGGGLIAGNLVYANGARGIYISGSQNVWVVYNTVAGNEAGIVCMPRGPDWPLENVRVMGNLLLRNYISGPGHPRGCDLTVYMGEDQSANPQRTVTSNHSDHNIYSTVGCSPTMRHHWNPDNSLALWRERFGEDLHSRLEPVEFEMRGTGFELLTSDGLEVDVALPAELGWQPKTPGRAGCEISRWPCPG